MPRKAQGTKRRKRDPERPKRAMTAYMVYVRDNIKNVTRDMGNAKRSEVIRECGSRWNSMTHNQKKKYVNVSKQDKERYAREMANYTPTTQVDEPKLKRRKKDPDAPKRPLTTYMAFVSHHQKLVAGQYDKQKDVLQHISNLWRNATNKDKKKFAQEANADRARYQREMANYQPPPREPKPSKRSFKKASIPRKPKRAVSAYAFFVKERRPQIARDFRSTGESSFKDGQEIIKIVSAMWKDLPPRERKKFDAKAKRDKKRFENELDKWTYEHGEDAAKEASSSKSKGSRSKKSATKAKARGGRRRGASSMVV
jgi:high mobility group protein B2